MKKISIIITILILIGVAGFYFWQNRKGFLFKGEPTFETEDESDEELEDIDLEAEKILQDEGDLEEDIDDESDDDEVDDSSEYDPESDYQTPVISNEDCDNDCGDFDDKDDEAFCLEYCGLTEDDPDRRSEGCEELDKLERDACFKQQAVEKQDMSICKKISDAQLEENCENRVLEDLLK